MYRVEDDHIIEEEVNASSYEYGQLSGKYGQVVV